MGSLLPFEQTGKGAAITWNVMSIVVMALLTGALLLVTGCRETYSQFCTQRAEKIDCLRPADASAEAVLNEHLPDVADEQCAYTFRLLHHEVKACTDPKAKAVGSDFDGYVKLQVFYGGVCYYRVQTDYKSGSWRSTLPELVKRMKIEVLKP